MKRKKMLIISALLFIILVCGCLFVSCNGKTQKTKTNQIVEVKESKSDSKKEKKEKDSEKIESQEEAADQEEEKEEAAQKTTTENKTKAPSGETKVSSSGSKSTKDSSNVTPSTNKTPDTGKSTTTNSHTHTHDWKEEKTKVSHKEEGHWDKVCVKEAWTEEVPVYETVCLSICNVCGADITGNTTPHLKAHALAYEGGGHHTEYVQRQTGTKNIEHPAEYKDQWIIDKKAWEETVITYKCSCGATK